MLSHCFFKSRHFKFHLVLFFITMFPNGMDGRNDQKAWSYHCLLFAPHLLVSCNNVVGHFALRLQTINVLLWRKRYRFYSEMSSEYEKDQTNYWMFSESKCQCFPACVFVCHWNMDQGTHLKLKNCIVLLRLNQKPAPELY